MPGFLPRLFQIAGDPTNKDVIRWNPTGDIVVLVDLLKVAALGISTTDEGKQYQGQFRGHGFRHVVIESQGKVLFGWKHRVINRHFPLEKLDSLSAKDAMRLGS
ncbi:hypothetical protein MKEN_00956700 [Mycena kentingensis (nom. inval.)]|nr:hypothetical protein MKEN_00956700 [Mycena kentingensis (nom. inval.)]